MYAGKVTALVGLQCSAVDNLTADIIACFLAVDLCDLKLKKSIIYKYSHACFNIACKIGIVYSSSLCITDNIFRCERVLTARLKLNRLIVLELFILTSGPLYQE